MHNFRRVIQFVWNAIPNMGGSKAHKDNLVMKIYPFTVGPILGYVSSTTARIFGRGEYTEGDPELKPSFGRRYRNQHKSPPRRIFSAIRVRSSSSTQFGEPIFCKLLPYFDFTGVSIIPDLAADSEYHYQAGWFCSDGRLPDPRNGGQLDWRDAPIYSFRTASEDAMAERSFVFGSCRYLLRLFGGTIFEDRGDKTFRSITQQREAGCRTDLLLMTGDQIYADDLNVVSADEQVDEFLERYRIQFSQPHLKNLMAHVPTYMTLDDHEIEDNWPQSASKKDYQVKYPAAMHAYSIYQMSHSPLALVKEDENKRKVLAGLPNHFWYHFSDGCCDFFVTDTRTERYGDEIISPKQMIALKKWLADDLEPDKPDKRVKVIVSSVPLFPDFQPPDADKWSGFLSQRDELLNFIYDRGIEKVLTLSGDVHCSMSVELVSRSNPKFKVVSVVSSPFFWPYPHFTSDQFQLSGDLLSHSPYGFQLAQGSDVISTENFTRLTVNCDRVKVEVFGRKGSPLAEPKVHNFV